MPSENKFVGVADSPETARDRDPHLGGAAEDERMSGLLIRSLTEYAIYMLDPSGRVSSWNSGAGRIIGYLPEEIIGAHFSSFYPPDDIAKGAPQRALHLAATRGKSETDGWRLRKDGGYFWANVVTHPVRGAEGELIGFTQVARDITEQLGQKVALSKTQETLRDSEERFRGAFESAIHGIALVSMEGSLVKVNQALCNMVGYTEEALLATSLQAITHPDDLDVDTREGMALLEGSIASYHAEKRYLHKDGHDIWVLLSAALVRADDRRPLHFVVQIQDISESKRVAAILRDRELQLQEEKERAEKANRAKSDFLAAMSHELRTPLNAVIGFAQMLLLNRTNNLDAAQIDYCRYIENGGKHLLNLINEVLELAVIESDQLKLSIERVSVPEVLRRVSELMTSVASAAEISFVVTGFEAPDVHADDLRLCQCLINLVSNAVKYNHRGGSVALTATAQDDKIVRFEVTDTGFGIAQEKQKDVFTPFDRGGAEQTSIEGTGIGLTLVKRYVEEMNGAIGFTSVLGQGSRFWIDVPQETAEATAVLPAGFLAHGRQDRARQGGYSLLYVEDNPSNLKLMESILSTIPGVAMLSASSPQLGIEIAVAHRPSVIVLDLNLPEMDGYKLLAKLKALPETRNIPVLALTAAAMPHDIERGLAAGFFRYLTKPIDVTALLSSITAALTTGEQSAAQFSTSA